LSNGTVEASLKTILKIPGALRMIRVNFASMTFHKVFLSGVLALLCSSCASITEAPTVHTEKKDLQRLVEWFAGEWDNHEQLWQQKGDANDAKREIIEDPILHTHHIFAPVSAPKIGEYIFVCNSMATVTQRKFIASACIVLVPMKKSAQSNLKSLRRLMSKRLSTRT
jgi:hypothetical protein